MCRLVLFFVIAVVVVVVAVFFTSEFCRFILRVTVLTSDVSFKKVCFFFCFKVLG